MNITQGLYFKMDGNKSVLEKVDVIQGAIKNNKMRQHIQKQVAGDSDRRVGVADPGHTRWDSRYDQLKKQLQLRGPMRNSTEDEEWKSYFDDRQTNIIRDYGHWEKVVNMKDEIEVFHKSIKKLEGIFLV